MATRQVIFSSFIILFSICVGFAKEFEEYPPKELIEMLQPMHDYCKNDAGVTEEEIKTFDVMTNHDRRIQCYMACIMKQSNWMTTTGEIKYDFIINNPWEPIREIIVSNVNKCRNIEDNEDECILIHNFAKCLHEVDPEHWFLP